MSKNGSYELNKPYHIYNRGSRRQRIFFEEENYAFLVRLMSQNYDPEQLRMTAYVLMPNHYHVLISQQRRGTISRVLRGTFQSYTQGINARYDISGGLFQGPPKVVKIKEMFRCLHLCRYIHLNPVEANLVCHPMDWEYSNYQEYVGARPGVLWNRQLLEHFFAEKGAYTSFVESAMEESDPHDALCNYELEGS